jgi:hypothetical protein
MDLNLQFEEGFVKKGKPLTYGGADYKPSTGTKTLEQIQIDRIRNELSKYDITENRKYDLSNEMLNLNSVKNMNAKYLAAVLVILEDFIGSYNEEEEFITFIAEVLNNKDYIKPYIDRLAENNDISYIKLVKSVLLSYLYKVCVNRRNRYRF